MTSTFALLAAVFFLTAVVSVVTGGTSLITVPVMIECGMNPHVVVATNMLALVFLSLGGTLPFAKGGALPGKRLPTLTVLTLAGSCGGALLLLAVPSGSMPLVVASAMLAVLAVAMAKPGLGLSASGSPSRRGEIGGYVATFVLGIYGGFFSGGYVALLTAAYVCYFRMTFAEAVAVTKFLNFSSSLVAVVIFAWQGIIDWKSGLLLGAVSFVGAVLGAAVARRMSERWLRGVFLAAVALLAIKLLCDSAR